MLEQTRRNIPLLSAGSDERHGFFIKPDYRGCSHRSVRIGEADLFAYIETLHLCGAPMLIEELQPFDDQAIHVAEVILAQGLDELLYFTRVFALHGFLIIHSVQTIST